MTAEFIFGAVCLAVNAITLIAILRHRKREK